MLLTAVLLAALATGAVVYSRVRRKSASRRPGNGSGAFATVTRIDPEHAAREILETMADAVVVCDPGGRILLTNHAVQRILGYPPDQLVGRSIELLAMDAESTFAHTGKLQRVLEQGTVREKERTFYRADGTPVEVSLSASSLIRDDEHAGIVIAIRDITERKQAERKLRSTAATLSSTLESTADGILVTDLFGNVVIGNGQLSRILSLRDAWADNIGTARQLDELLARLARPDEFWALLRTLLERPRAESFEVVELVDGRIVEVRSVPQTDGVDVIGRVWSFRDITQRRKAEAALRASERRYRQLFERNLAGVYRASVEGVILDCNEAFARIFRFKSPAELIGRSLDELSFDSRERSELIKMIGHARSMSGLELSLKRHDGERVWVLENMTLIENPGESATIEGTLVDISGLKMAEEQMEFQAYHDVLTMLPNRRLFTDRLTLALAQSRRTGTPLAAMFLDLDNFKTINDTHGHAIGDELLIAVAERLGGALREGDTVARIGGDEFTILCTGLQSSEDAVRVAEHVVDVMSRPFHLGSHAVYATASIGVALAPEDGIDAEMLLRNADSALYRAKEAGGNNFQLCTNELKMRREERLALENSIRLALENDEFELYYQPVVNIVSGKVSAVEALLRWNHPQLGLASPDLFIPVLEESRLVFPVGEWVLRTACAQAKKWISQGRSDFYVSVNLSARQFQQRDLARLVRDVLESTGLPARHLQIEITETTAMGDVDATVETLKELRQMGVAISIDDFGVGYSSLGYLKTLPIDCVKIDRSFVRDLDTDPSGAAIVHAVLGLGEILKLRVIAEGVETERQFSLLRDRGCFEMQGFLFSRPLPAGDVSLQMARSLPLLSPQTHVV